SFQSSLIHSFTSRKCPMIAQRIPVTLLLVAGIVWDLSPATPRALAAEPEDAKLKELLTERRETLRKVVDLSLAQYAQGTLDLTPVVQAQQALAKAELELCDSDKKRIAVLEQSIALAKKFESMVEGRWKAGAVGTTARDLLMAKVNRL